MFMERQFGYNLREELLSSKTHIFIVLFEIN